MTANFNCYLLTSNLLFSLPSSLIKPIALATGREPYFCGKPNPLMMRAAIQKLGVQREDSIIIGDRMDTDVLAGVQSGKRFSLFGDLFDLSVNIFQANFGFCVEFCDFIAFYFSSLLGDHRSQNLRFVL